MAVTFRGSIPSASTLGNAALTQNLFTITNKVGSRVNIILRHLDAMVDTTVASTTPGSVLKLSRATSISGGAIVTPSKFITTETQSAYTEIRTPILDGMPITATPGDIIAERFTSRLHTAVEQVTQIEYDILPSLVATQDFVIQPGESILVRAVSSNVAANSITGNNWYVQASWEEDALSTFNISGTVTLGGSPVSGAIVTVIEADDNSMTNQVLVEKIVTGAGGTWASTIKTGKVGAAFVQYESGGTFYTAPGSPYLE